MSDETNLKQNIMPANYLRKTTCSLRRKGKPTSLPQSPTTSEFDYSSPVSPFSENYLSSCSSMSSLNQDEQPSNPVPQHTTLTSSYSMSSLQQDDQKCKEPPSPKLSHHLHHHCMLTPSLSMSSLTQSGRPRSLMESILIAKMEKASLGGGSSLLNGYVSPSSKSLMRTDSLGSTSSFTSASSIGSDYCRCDDCLLGIVDLSLNYSQQQVRRKKVIRGSNCPHLTSFFPVFLYILLVNYTFNFDW